MRMAVVVGSTRPGRRAPVIADWVMERARDRSDATFELVDLAHEALPMLDESQPPSLGRYEHEHTRRWAARIEAFDGFVFVTPEYNHSTSAALKNALDFVYAQWNNKAAGFVSYGSAGGVRAVEHLRLICAELQMATVRTQVALYLDADFVNYGEFKPREGAQSRLDEMLTQTISWARALQSVR